MREKEKEGEGARERWERGEGEGGEEMYKVKKVEACTREEEKRREEKKKYPLSYFSTFFSLLPFQSRNDDH